MKIFLLITILSVTAFAYGKLTEKHRWGSSAKQSVVGVINGKNASIEKFPYMASFTIQGVFLGSGVILNSRWILTTAFIVGGESVSDVKIRVGSDMYDSGGTIVKAKEIIVPSEYTGEWDYDIGLVKLKTPMKFGKTLRSIKLGSETLKNGTKVTIAGWGDTVNESAEVSETLKSAKLTVISRKKCASTYYDETISKFMCTYDKNVGPSMCDFGDPLILENAVYGLFAGANDLIPGDYPMIYTDVTKYRKWIKSYIRK